jgi:hypothetical protein
VKYEMEEPDADVCVPGSDTPQPPYIFFSSNG